MENEALDKRRKQAIEIMTKNVTEAYLFCRDEDEIDWLSFNFGRVTGEFLLRRARKPESGNVSK